MPPSRSIRLALPFALALATACPAAAATQVIDFDDADAPFAFSDTNALRDKYAALGVTFTAPGDNGVAILDDASAPGVSGFSAPNFLAFNKQGTLADGGAPVLPETLLFDPPVAHVAIEVGDYQLSTISIEAFDAGDQSLGTDSVQASDQMQPLAIDASGIVRVVVTSDGVQGILDDLEFGSAAALCGDANGDGHVTASDALAALKTAVGSADCPVDRCDFNGDGHVLAADALAILKTAVGQDTTPSCPAA
ncbi:MAG TPA: dockerin type I domain-containing protein [Candidatus Binatia bacterium]|jgi:hypothetical protein